MQTVTPTRQSGIPNGWIKSDDERIAATASSSDRRLFGYLLNEDGVHELKHVQQSLDLMVHLIDLASSGNESTINAKELASVLTLILGTLEVANARIVNLKGLHSLASLGVEESENE
ncbi:hypothetical protein [uncultured Serratia sp.]|uniref:hypothetical protein n=1 Tax=uncultured Serratia sp. TaxID=239175 RepID=UPI00258CD9C2|nr:hypothetical protein [uncultured Serratia sp.]